MEIGTGQANGKQHEFGPFFGWRESTKIAVFRGFCPSTWDLFEYPAQIHSALQSDEKSLEFMLFSKSSAAAGNQTWI